MARPCGVFFLQVTHGGSPAGNAEPQLGKNSPMPRPSGAQHTSAAERENRPTDIGPL